MAIQSTHGTNGREATPRPRPKRRTLELLLIVATTLAIGLLASYLFYRHLVPAIDVAPLYAVVIVIDGYLVIRLATIIIERALEPTIGVTRTHGVKNVVQIVGAIFVISAIFTVLGVNLSSLLIGAGFLGIVLGLAAQQVLGNIFAGISIFISRPFEIGDRVTIVNSSYGLLAGSYPRENSINGFTGTINDIGIFFTRVLLDDGSPSVFPNSVMNQSLIISHDKIFTKRVRVRIDLDKGIEFSEFRSRMLEALKKHDGLDEEKSNVELIEIGILTYQVVVIVRAYSVHEEPIKTIVIQEALRIQRELTPKSEGDSKPADAQAQEGSRPNG
ncbi:MAG: mechanosensitive ion channel family protein [Thaumarchaeota archaeon]|nr:mechanosensitive ion channel family protein [Nitrososphaerota archaeon]